MKCPKCGSNRIREMEDRSKLITMVGHIPKYAKYYVCKDCAHQWTPEEGSS